MPMPSATAAPEKLYLIPIERIITPETEYRGPGYFCWRFTQNPNCIIATWSLLDYGFIDEGLIYAPDISVTDNAFLLLQSDVYAFDLALLDSPVVDKAVLLPLFEGVNIPVDWVTPSTTYRELFRNMAGLFSFNQRYEAISGGASLFGNGITLETRWNTLSIEQQTWFNATVASFGFPFTVSGNPKLRTLARQASSFWESTPFVLGDLII